MSGPAPNLDGLVAVVGPGTHRQAGAPTHGDASVAVLTWRLLEACLFVIWLVQLTAWVM